MNKSNSVFFREKKKEANVFPEFDCLFVLVALEVPLKYIKKLILFTLRLSHILIKTKN